MENASLFMKVLTARAGEKQFGSVRNRHSRNLNVKSHQAFNKDNRAINRYKINDMEFIFLNP